MDAHAYLEMSNINKSFSSIPVLENVNFSLKSGEVHALMGGNGAGKSTLMKILTGVYKADSGTILLQGKPIEIHEPKDAAAYGIAMIFQEFSLVPSLTVAQNIFLNREPRTPLGLIDDHACSNQARMLLQELKVDINPDTPVEQLGVGYWQMTEIAKALSKNAKILIMDEPTSSLTENETEVLFKFIKTLKEKNISVIYISHRMDEIFEVCDRTTILRDGRCIVTEGHDTLTVEKMIEHIIGGNVEKSFSWTERGYDRSAEPILSVKNLKSGTRVRGIDFQVHKGEILGIAGLMGSGRSETMRALFGIDPIDSGEVYINGKKVNIKTPNDAIESGLALVPEDRRVQGLVLDHDVKSNIMLPFLGEVTKGWLIDDAKSNEITQEYVNKLNIKTDSIFKKTNLLSGGNQQKIVLAKWLTHAPDILLLDEPTIGVDIGAKTEIMDIVREFADAGKAVVIVSSEITELLALADRVLVFHDGKAIEQFDRKEIESEEVLQHAIQS